MVLKTSDDLPEPERPVNTVIKCLSIFISIFFKLFCEAPTFMGTNFPYALTELRSS